MEEEGWRIPDHLYPPEVIPGTESWLAAFYELGADRQVGFGTGPIPASSIDRYTTGWLDGEAEVFRHAMRAMDNVYLKSLSPDGDVPESDNPARDAFRAAMR